MGTLAVLRHVAMAKLKKIILRCAMQSYQCWCLRLRDISLFAGFYSIRSSIMQYMIADKPDENVMITCPCHISIFTIGKLKVTALSVVVFYILNE